MTFNELGNWAIGYQGAIQSINEVFTEIQIERKEAIIDELDKQYSIWSEQSWTLLKWVLQDWEPLEVMQPHIDEAREQARRIRELRDATERTIKSMKEGK